MKITFDSSGGSDHPIQDFIIRVGVQIVVILILSIFLFGALFPVLYPVLVSRFRNNARIKYAMYPDWEMRVEGYMLLVKLGLIVWGIISLISTIAVAIWLSPG